MKGMDLQMAQKKRIRDRLFPEGGKIRSYLRTTNRFVKSMFSIDYLKEQKNKIKEKGWRVTWIEMKRYMVMGTAAEPENLYQIWIEKNEYSYDNNKILNKIQEILAEKRIIIC